MRIVLIDDEDSIRNGTAYLLQQLEMDLQIVGTARNGQEGLEKIRLLRPDLAMVDIRMPIMDGLAMAKAVQESHILQDTKIIMLSAHSEFEYAQSAMRYGVEDFIIKPLDTNVLQEALQRLLRATRSPANPMGNMGSELMNRWMKERRVSHPLVSGILIYIGQNYMKNIQLIDIAEHFQVSPSYISSLFKKWMNESLITLLNRFRIALAQQIISSSDYKIHEISYMVGFNNLNYFDRVFKSITKLTPNEYKLSSRNGKL